MGTHVEIQSPACESAAGELRANRVELHADAVTLVAAMLPGCRLVHAGELGDLVYRGQTIGVHVASNRTRPIKVRVAGVDYRYEYAGACWSIHTRGRSRPQPDWLILIVLGGAAFVMPSRVLGSRLTMYLHRPEREQISGQLGPYREAWGLLRRAA